MTHGVEHHFIAGIRARAGVQYRCAGKRWSDLNLARNGVEAHLACLSLAAMALSRAARDRVERLASNHAADVLASLGLASSVAAAVNPRQVGLVARRAIDVGHVPIVQFRSDAGGFSSVVIGIELIQASPTALLLLATSHPAPWIGPYNARLELRSSRAIRPPGALPLRFADGEFWSVELSGLVVVHRA